MRTTLDLNDAVLTAARRRAAKQGVTLTAFVEAALAAAVAPPPQRGKPFRLRWKPHRGRLLPGIDLTDRDALYDRMDGRG
jgi:hypothetical protein